MRSAAFVAGILLIGLRDAAACGDELTGATRTLENAHYVVAFRTTPDPIAVGQHFVVDFAVCPRNAVAAPSSVRIDATMPEHRHGMNYRADVTRVRPGLYRAEGLLLHMPGRWELTFDIVDGNVAERLASTLRLE